MAKIDVDNLIFDIGKICDFVFENKDGRTNDAEITETFLYDNETKEMIPSTREVKEYKVNDYNTQNTVRYDLLRGFIETLNSTDDSDIMTLGEKITLNTMLSYGMIKEIK